MHDKQLTKLTTELMLAELYSQYKKENDLALILNIDGKRLLDLLNKKTVPTLAESVKIYKIFNLMRESLHDKQGAPP